MKVRWIILRALLLVLVVSPSAMRAMPRQLSIHACRTAKSHIRTTYNRQRHTVPQEVAYSQPGHNRPEPRMHRIRGKKVSIQRGFATAQAGSAPARYVLSISQALLQNPDGPNPSRGPPAQSL